MFEVTLIVFSSLFIVFSAICLGRWAVAIRALRRDAQDEFSLRQNEKPTTIKGLSERDFSQIYISSHQPRWALYAAGGAIASLLITPVALVVIPVLYNIIWTINGAPQWGNQTGYVYMFSLFFALCFVWSFVMAAASRLLHQRRPEPFSHALARARGEPLPEHTSWRRRPKWARKVRLHKDHTDPSVD